MTTNDNTTPEPSPIRDIGYDHLAAAKRMLALLPADIKPDDTTGEFDDGGASVVVLLSYVHASLAIEAALRGIEAAIRGGKTTAYEDQR